LNYTFTDRLLKLALTYKSKTYRDIRRPKYNNEVGIGKKNKYMPAVLFLGGRIVICKY